MAALRERGLSGRADWVDRQLPALIDIATNAALLRTLGIDSTAMRPVDGPNAGITPEPAHN